ncbi:MAG: hypothetical protein U5Q03_08810 [Bacteroidota bacterium]|nr:hypothetical protein [Bacteroidota bacterium]
MITNSTQKKKNKQKKGKMDEYREWSDSMKKELADIYGDLALKYEYKI